MRAAVSMEEVDMKATEEFLIAQDEIMDASVWYDGSILHAHVTLSENAHWDDRTLREACARKIGRRQTPTEFMLLRHRSRKA